MLSGFILDSKMEFLDKGIYNKDKISKLQSLYISMEDARRIYAAKGLKTLAQDYNREYPSSNRGNRNQIAVVYPKAHASRIVDYMTSKNAFVKGMETAKKFLYSLPNLDYSYRIYNWKDTLAKVSNKPELAAWQLTTEKKFSPVF